MIKIIHLTPKPQVQIDAKSASVFDQNRYSYPIWPVWPNLALFGPIDPFCCWCSVKQFDICTDSGNYFQKRTMSQSLGSLLLKLAVVGRFDPNLAQIWPNLVHLKTSKDWHYVIGALRVLMTLKNILRLKIQSLKSKIAEIILLYFRLSKSARSLKQLGKHGV